MIIFQDHERKRLNAISIAQQFIAFLKTDGPYSEKSATIEGLENLAKRAPSLNRDLIFSKVDNRRKRERISSIFKAKPSKRKSTIDKLPRYSSPTNELIQQCNNSPIDNPCWMFLLSMNIQSVLKKIHECSAIIKIERFMENFDLAKAIWQCEKCHDLSKVKRNFNGYVHCEKCDRWFHAECVGVVDINEKDYENCSWECPDHDDSL